MLWLLKLLPNTVGTGPGKPWWIPGLSWLGLASGAIVIVATLLLIVHGRFVVSDVSAAGAAVKLSPRSSTYFDEYLEEIVYFFDKVFPEVVIFEDLDRFDDPHIFEALRELNTLLNQTPKRLKGNPLRFIYAIKDSLFEKLGSDTEKSQDDAAAIEVVRANRTKFFDVVIPVVPFISHRNARELLDELLKNRGVAGIERPLVALVARHATDMRLLRNICNEYSVFAERLLVSDKTAPGLTSSNLFALVAYKNFHLNDFERISHRSSDLDELYDLHRKLVRESIDECERRKRNVLAGVVRYQTRALTAERIGNRLIAVWVAVKASTGHAGWPSVRFSTGSEDYTSQEVTSYEFWVKLTEAGHISIIAQSGPSTHPVGNLDRGLITALFPEAVDADQWFEYDEQAAQAALKQLDDDVAFLRGADFKDLMRESRFTLPLGNSDKNFIDLVDTTMKSKLARDLVRHGYLDRNFALYAAVFYGHFTGVDVATFIVRTVQVNQMDIDYTFTGPEAIKNLLNEAPEEFSRTISAYNTQLLDYLLKENDARAEHIADTIASNFGRQEQKFLESYFNSGQERAAFAALLSRRPWSEVFAYLALEEGIPVDIRPALVDSALRAANRVDIYELNRKVCDFIIANYSEMEAFTHRQDDSVAAKVVAFMEELGAVLPELAILDNAMRDCIVHHDLYRLTADNLRVALDVSGDISYDRVREHPDVLDRCRRSPNEYLIAVRNDELTQYSVHTETALAEALTELSEVWGMDHLRELIATAAPDSQLEHLDSIPEPCWPDLATHHLFRATVRNVLAYSKAIGSIDQRLAELLVRSGSIESAGEGETAKANVAIDILNATEFIPESSHRVNLAASLDPEEYMSPAAIESVTGDLLALLLDHNLVEDSLESFMHFRSGGWATIEPAIAKSKKFVEFMNPDLVSEFIPDLLGSRVSPSQAKYQVISDFERYVPDDAASLSAAGQYAFSQRRNLAANQVRRIAAATKDQGLTLKLLASAAPLVDATELVMVLTELGDPYSNLTSRAQDKFEVSSDHSHRTVLDRLKKAGVVSSFTKRRLKDVYVVKLA